MRDYPPRDLNNTAGWEIAGCRLEEEERLLWEGVLKFLDMVRVVTPYRNYLCLELDFRLNRMRMDNDSQLTFLPFRTKEAAMVKSACDEARVWPRRRHSEPGR
jgi:hypothetical protein